MNKFDKNRRNLVIYDLQGNPFFLLKDQSAELSEDVILEEFLSAYDEAEVFKIDNDILVYYGINEESKIWEYNHLASNILQKSVYSSVMIFVDPAEIEEGKELMDPIEFQQTVYRFLTNEWNKIYKANEQPEPKRSPKYGFTKIEIHHSTEKTLLVDFDNVDEFFETYCKNKFMKENIVTECQDKDECGIIDMMWKPGILYIHNRTIGSLDAYFTGNYENVYNKYLN